jgi:hypothetical protein
VNSDGIIYAIDGDRYVLSPRVKRLKSALAKLDPASVERTVALLPPSRPAGTPSLVYLRLKAAGDGCRRPQRRVCRLSLLGQP